jgi:hypothetical protein
MWTEIDKMSFLSKQVVDLCNRGLGDVFGSWGVTQCIKIQTIYYSPWILGFIGTVILAKAGPYRGYDGYGGAGSHGRRMRLRPKTKKRLTIIITICIAIAIGIFMYANFDITIGDQKVDDIIPPESFEKTLETIAEKIPIKIAERP